MPRDYTSEDWLRTHHAILATYANAGVAPPLEALADHPLLHKAFDRVSHLAVMISDLAKDCILNVTPGIEYLLGIPPSDWIGQPLAKSAERHYPADQEGVYRIAARGFGRIQMSPQICQTFEMVVKCRLVHRNGDAVWIHTTITPLFIDPGTQHLVLFASVLTRTIASAEGRPVGVLWYRQEDGHRVEERLDTAEAPQSAETIVFQGREQQVLRMLAQGKTSRQIAELLEIKTDAVNKHRRKLLERTNTANTADLVRKALEGHWI